MTPISLRGVSKCRALHHFDKPGIKLQGLVLLLVTPLWGHEIIAAMTHSE
jgi:hypothetical protein